MRISEEELEERKHRLLHSAYDLFCEYGIDAVSIPQISKKSAISLNSIYSYFDSKATLIRHAQKILWYEMTGKLLSDSQEQLSAAANGLEEMKILLENFQLLYENYSNYLLFSCEYKLYLVRNNLKLSKYFYWEIMEPVYNTFTKALEHGRADGSIATDLTTEKQFYAIWGTMWSFVEQIVLFDHMYDAPNTWKEQFHIVLTYALQGLENK